MGKKPTVSVMEDLCPSLQGSFRSMLLLSQDSLRTQGFQPRPRALFLGSSLPKCTQKPPLEFCQGVDGELGTVPKECEH